MRHTSVKTHTSLKFFDKLKFAAIPSGELAYYAYALTCCQFPASLVRDEWHRAVYEVCSSKLSELRQEITLRLESEPRLKDLTHALAVIEGKASLTRRKKSVVVSVSLSQMSVCQLVALHSASNYWYDMRRIKKMEVFTRAYQWQIVNELLTYKEGKLLANILQLAESIEADNYAHNINLTYKIGECVKSFKSAEYASDEELKDHIIELSRKANYVSREELIQIADYIQTEIVAKGETANHMELVHAILSTDMPSFDYPQIVKAFEKATKQLAKSEEKKDLELAPFFYSLWSLTSKFPYLNRFEKTVRQCYQTLTTDKHYPHLGINKDDPSSISSALRFLTAYRQNPWVNTPYDIPSLLRKYPH